MWMGRRIAWSVWSAPRWQLVGWWSVRWFLRLLLFVLPLLFVKVSSGGWFVLPGSGPGLAGDQQPGQHTEHEDGTDWEVHLLHLLYSPTVCVN